jgi:hypothetical protein
MVNLGYRNLELTLRTNGLINLSKGNGLVSRGGVKIVWFGGRVSSLRVWFIRRCVFSLQTGFGLAYGLLSSVCLILR